MNHLYFGDCLDVLKQLKDENPQPFTDLIYIDPPFNSKRNYNVLFESMDMKDATVCFDSTVTKDMIKKAKDAGHIKIDTVEFPQDKVQILTIEDLFNGRQPQLPFNTDNTTFKKAQRNESKSLSKGLFD